MDRQLCSDGLLTSSRTQYAVLLLLLLAHTAPHSLHRPTPASCSGRAPNVPTASAPHPAGEITQQMLKNSAFPGSNNGTGLFQTIVGLKVREAYERIVKKEVVPAN